MAFLCTNNHIISSPYRLIRDKLYTRIPDMRYITRASSNSTVTENRKTKKSSVVDYYNGKSILITGGTGFLGKAYIRKLLDSCPGINKIYMLIRASTKETARGRIEQMIKNSSQLFQNIKEDRFAKLIPIQGDLTSPNLGIHPDEEKLLLEEISIIVHSAASIEINETLRDAININVNGTQNLLDLAKRMKNLEAFLHVSTFFCAMTSNKITIEEHVNPPPINPEDIPKILEKYGHMRFPPKNILREKQNTYIFSKAISEYMVNLNHGEIPTAIIRPSLIGTSDTEPYEGWIDVLNIHSVMLAAISNGLIRVMNVDKNSIFDFVPVDCVANCMILAATKCKRSKDVDVYNCVSSGFNQIQVSKVFSIFISDFVNNKYNKLPYPFVLYMKRKILFSLITPIVQSIPAYIMDLICKFSGKRANSVKYVKIISGVSDEIKYFGNNSWRVKSDRVTSLINSLNDDDRRKFPCDLSTIDWVKYFNKYSEGIRNYMLKQENEKKIH